MSVVWPGSAIARSATGPSVIVSPSLQRLDLVGVGDAALQSERGQTQRGAGLLAEHPGAGEVVRMEVGVEDVGDADAELVGERRDRTPASGAGSTTSACPSAASR